MITSVEKITYYLIETDDKEYNTFRRPENGNPDGWEVLMGDSWEPAGADLEQEFLEFNKK